VDGAEALAVALFYRFLYRGCKSLVGPKVTAISFLAIYSILI